MNIVYSKLNGNQKKAYDNFIGAANDIIGGLENTLMDYEEDSPEYIKAEECLKDHDELVSLIYFEGTHNYYSERLCAPADQYGSEIRSIRFCSKKWLAELAEYIVTKNGY